MQIFSSAGAQTGASIQVSGGFSEIGVIYWGGVFVMFVMFGPNIRETSQMKEHVCANNQFAVLEYWHIYCRAVYEDTSQASLFLYWTASVSSCGKQNYK